jgi:hypothetical protein
MAATNGTPTNGMASGSGTADLLSRGLALARALSTAPDATVNAPLVEVDVVDEAPVLDEPTPEEWTEIEELRNEAAARDLLDRSATLSLADLADHVATHFRGWHNDAGDLFARTLEELGQKIRFTQADTPADFEARLEILEADRDDSHYRDGYENGLIIGRRQGPAHTGPLD